LDILATAGYVLETIIVVLPNVNGKERQRDYTPPFMKMDIDEIVSPLGKGDQFLSYMEKELFPYIEENYSTSKIRLLAGNSSAFILDFQHPCSFLEVLVFGWSLEKTFIMKNI
jgi:predicted alpha/beta superfamily hydrolase